ncbi:MAG TPA: winged helix-turn-helix domain-containing protein [Nitrososphaera sp.]|nr:winged helix-turn-helix domain-containing protein [Nitrososphaera sp.]
MDIENSDNNNSNVEEMGNSLDDNTVQKLLSAINSGSTTDRQLQSSLDISEGELYNYLKELVKDSLVGYDIHDGETLKITQKGLRFLISYERVLMSKTEHQPPKGLLDIR